MRTVQILDDGFEALYKFNNEVTDKQIKLYYKEFLESEILHGEYFDSFEDFMEEKYPAFGCERFFVDSEIFID